MRRSSLGKTTRVQMKEGFNLRDWESNRMNRGGGAGFNNRRQNVVNMLSSAADFISSPKRWLRSDTVAATPTKTLRSRNVELISHTPNSIQIASNPCSRTKPNSSLLVPSKLKQNNSILATSTPQNQSTEKNV